MTNSNGSDDRLDRIEKALEELKEGHNEIKKRLDTLDSRLFELILRYVSQ
jgi:tetrahydromethanopterin S-methyltransferase subunit G